jgi:photosystem II stability/assembly factor-like uncharacterized protein
MPVSSLLRDTSKLALLLVFFCLAVAVTAPAQQVDLAGEEDEQLQSARAEWFFQQRSYPQGFIPSRARLNAIDQMDQMQTLYDQLRLASAGKLGYLPTAGFGTTWNVIGPKPESIPDGSPPFLGTANVSGRVTALVSDPDGNLYLGSAVGGAWKSSDRGAKWQSLMSQQASLAIGSVAIDPMKPSVIYAGTGDNAFGNPSYYGVGILKSTNGGTGWSLLGQNVFAGPFGANNGGAYIASVAVSHADSNLVLAAVTFFGDDDHSGIYRSTDGGKTWTDDPDNLRKPVLPGGSGCQVFFDRRDASGKVVYAAIGTPQGSPANGIYVSNDSGQTWARVAGRGLPGGSGWIAMAMSQLPSTKTIIYASIANAFKDSHNLNGFFRTENGGTNWESRFPEGSDFCQPQCSFDNVVAVSPVDADVVAVGGSYDYGRVNSSGEAVMMSADGGKNWRKITKGNNNVNVHADVHALLFSADGKSLYVGSDGGMWRSDNVLVNALPDWTELNSTLSTTLFYPGLSIRPDNIKLSLGGTQDNGTPIYKGGLQWGYGLCSDGGWTAIDARANPLTAYAACAGNVLVIGKSTLQEDGTFGPWMNKVTGITGPQPNFLPPLIADPSTSKTLYYGTSKVWQTVNGGDQWNAVSPQLTGNDETLATVALGDTDDNMTTMLAGTGKGHIWITKDVTVGATWNKIDAGLPPRAVTQIAVKTNDVLQPAYATFSGFSRYTTTGGGQGGDGKGHLFTASLSKTNISWSDISQGPFGLPDVPVNDIVIDPDLCDTLYVATDIGVFYSADAGARWQVLPTGLPRVVVMSLRLNQQFRILRAATHGFSAWDLSVPSSEISGVSLEPVSRDFGKQKVGTKSSNGIFVMGSHCLSRKPFTISNINVSNDNFTIEQGPNSCKPFVQTTFCVIYVSFTPQAPGKINSLLTITDNALGSPRASALSGEGTQ